MSSEPRPPSSLVDPRRLAAVAVLLGVSALMVALFLWMVGPAAAREVEAACNGMRPSPSGNAFPRLPAPAPDFALRDLEGNTVRLSDFQGKVVLVNFWASWCDVCKAEKRSLARITRDLGRDDLVVLTLASDDDLELVDRSMRQALGGRRSPEKVAAYGGAPFQILLDPPTSGNLGEVAAAWGIEKVPESFLIDRQGVIRMYLVNKRDWGSDVVQTCVRSLLDE
jgi:cytochrome c biogenesis protein CcmG, thiol:disulfide interchange protein DsbE